MSQMLFNAPISSECTTSPCPDCNFDFGASQNRIRGPPEALYTQYSTKNAYPSIKDETMIKNGIVEGLAQMSLISNKIDRMKEMAELLAAERSRIDNVIKEYRAMLKPINRLPPELLTRVFLFSSDLPAFDISEGFRGDPPPTSLKPTDHPWVSSQVCQTWRRTALNVPNLWSFISFTFPSEGDIVRSMPALRAHCHRLQLQLQRSANQPIDVITQTPDLNFTSIERLLSPLCSYSPNWRHLRLDLHGDTFSPWMSPISGRLQSLESLHVKFIGPIHGRHFDCFRFAPQLKSIVFSADQRISSEIWHPNKLRLPYQQIIHYRLQDAEGHGVTIEIRNKLFVFFHRSLYLFPELRTCHLSLHSESIKHYRDLQCTPTFAQGRLTVTFKELVQLKLHSINGKSDLHTVLPYIRAPSLTKLTILSSGPDRTALSTFMSHPQKLTFLSIDRVEMSPSEFSATLTRLTSLKDLSFGVARVGGITDEYLTLLRRLEPATRGFLIAPKLSSLSLIPVGDFASTYTNSALIDLLEIRWRVPLPDASDTAAISCLPIRSVRLDKGADDGRLDRLRVEGLHVELWGES
ncbi:hypothetical protein AAF712_010747 [Marasmius tenuissimus]|uniref:F-box domain-containing protein n=1 Tax=Marasmius tenuissimus TaxID=585030 RepID=A0ABR2ZMY7_9AGAR|nr:hypothetical protein PM082_014532 [Marasmius tenuissimus]